MKYLMLTSLALMIFVGASFGDATGRRTFTPTYVSAGSWGTNNPDQYFWIIASDGTEYCLGKCDDAKAKALYSTALSALSLGKSLEIGIYALTSSTIVSPGQKIWNLPEFVRIINQ